MKKENRRLLGCTVALAVAAAIFCFMVVNTLITGGQMNKQWICSREVNSIEVAVAKILTDANVDDVRKLFDPDAFARAREAYVQRAGLDAFEASTEIYTAVFTSMLRHGKHAPEDLAASEDTKHLAGVLQQAVLPKLGQNYLALRTDPWGTSYHFFGPWPKEWGPILFRVHRVPDDAAPPPPVDALTAKVTDSAGETKIVGYPADPSKALYVWSCGPNKGSDQARFDPSGRLEPPLTRHYRPDASPEELGGGDDINSWDPYQRFGPAH